MVLGDWTICRNNYFVIYDWQYSKCSISSDQYAIERDKQPQIYLVLWMCLEIFFLGFSVWCQFLFNFRIYDSKLITSWGCFVTETRPTGITDYVFKYGSNANATEMNVLLINLLVHWNKNTTTRKSKELCFQYRGIIRFFKLSGFAVNI
jgi:hypothetical protein